MNFICHLMCRDDVIIFVIPRSNLNRMCFQGVISDWPRCSLFSFYEMVVGDKLKVYAGSEMKTVWQHLMQITTNSSSAHVYMQGRGETNLRQTNLAGHSDTRLFR